MIEVFVEVGVAYCSLVTATRKLAVIMAFSLLLVSRIMIEGRWRQSDETRSR